MKLYEVVTATKTGDEWTEYEGFDRAKALEALEEAKWNFEKYSTAKEKENEYVECKVYDIPDDIDINDKNEIINAICDCTGYDTIELEEE